MWRLLVALPLATANAYCNAGNTVPGDSNLGRVQLTGVEGKSIDDESNCPGSVGVIDRTDLVATLSPGKNFTLNFQATTCGSGWARIAYAFIDFNNNQVYDMDELIGQEMVDNTVDPVDVSFPFTVPCIGNGSVPGITRMRVFVVESGFNAYPCLTFSYGGVKEFSIEILDEACSSPGKYCNAGNTVAGGSNLGPVSLMGLLHTAIVDDSDCTGATGVQDFTKLSTSLMPGGTYKLDLDVTTCSGRGRPRRAYAYIDYNNNGKYDSTDFVGAIDVDSDPSPIDASFRVIVPCDAVPGVTRMRVLVVEGGQDVNPCAVFSYGAVKEYSILILNQLDKPCLPPVRYCKAGNLLAGDSNLGEVVLVGVQGTAIKDMSDCPNNPGLKNLTNLSVSLQPGGIYALNFEATTCGQAWERLAYAYIDFNANSVYEPWERLGSVVVPDTLVPVEVSFAFTVPCVGDGSVVGTTRLRVFVVEGNGIPTDPCAQFNYGAVKEFSVEILNKPIKQC